MNGTIAQAVALTCHGNAFLAGRSAKTFFPDNSTCQFCDRVSFVTLERKFFKVREASFAETPDDWFRLLRNSGAKGMRLKHSPGGIGFLSDRMSAGLVGGGGTWFIEVLMPENKTHYWTDKWEVHNPNAADKKIWRVTYGRVSKKRTSSWHRADLGANASELEKSLREIHAFAVRNRFDGFAKLFAEALDTLESRGRNLHGYHRDLAPKNFLSLDAAMILDACQSAWVFGGMGSWNDLYCPDKKEQKEYERVSGQLYKAVNKAIAAAASDSPNF